MPKISELPSVTTLTASTEVFPVVQAGTTKKVTLDRVTSSVNIKNFGAVGDGVTDDTAAFKAAIADTSVKHIFVPAGTYKITECLNIKRVITISGETGSGAAVDYPSFLSFSAGIVGIFLHRGDTYADTTGLNPIITAYVGGADGSIIENLAIVRGQGGNTTIDGVSHGVWAKCRATIRDCVIAGFGGNALHVVAAAGDPSPFYRGNANLFQAERVSCTNSYHGIFVDGADANAGTFTGVDASSNQAWGIYDSSFLGNTYVQPHTSGNAVGSYYVDNINAASVFVGPYSESGQLAEEINARSRIYGGQRGAVKTSLGYTNEQSTNSFSSSNPDGTTVTRVTITAGGAGYVTAPAVTFSAPTQTQATATATLNGGRVVKATLTNAGGGYTSTPAVTITGDGTGATAVAHLNNAGQVSSITINGLGSGYTTATVTIAAPAAGVTAQGTAIVSGGAVTGVVITTPGQGYEANPTVSFGGPGAGATATANRFAGSSAVTNSFSVGDLFNQANGDAIFSWSSNALAASAPYRFWMHRGTNDMMLTFGNGSSSASMLKLTGTSTLRTFGRTSPVQFVPHWSRGIWLGIDDNARNLSTSTSIPVANGAEYAQGDVVFHTQPVAGGSPGVVCTTAGTSGTTAVFSALSKLGGGGGQVTQATSKSTGVTLNTVRGEITMNAAALAATTKVSFTLTNSKIGVNDTIIIHRKSGGSAGSYRVWIDSVAAGSAVIVLENYSAGSLSEAVVLQYEVMSGAIA